MTPALFPGYAFVLVELQWHRGALVPWRAAPGARAAIGPARVPDRVIAELRGRERNGLITLPPPPGFHHGDRVRITRGVFAGQVGLYSTGMRPHERVAVLLQFCSAASSCRRGDIVGLSG